MDQLKFKRHAQHFLFAPRYLQAPPAKRPRHLGQKPSAIVLDIEGTIAPITFVSKTLVPYFLDHLQAFLEATYAS